MMIQNKILHWFDKHGRHNLPWQQRPTPYRVWISEIMLQQTQVATVIPYYQNFMQRFHSLQTLAAASLDEVLTYWSGLGYYARARNLHKTAKILVAQHRSRFPKTVPELCELPGIGRSTAGAILSLGMQIPAAILDGNVKRILCRLHAIDGFPSQTDVLKELWKLTEALTPVERSHHYNQAMMDLGASVCTPQQPSCKICPLKKNCLAFLQEKTHEYPQKKPKKTKPIQTIQMLLIEKSEGILLLEKRPPTGIWGGLWSFLECPATENVENWCEMNHGLKVKVKHELEKITHHFSHFSLTIHPKVLVLKDSLFVMQTQQQIWYDLAEKLPGGIASPLRKLLNLYHQPAK
jgi:A/G-specific adenine glycosylase